MTSAWCPWSLRILPGTEWWQHKRIPCPECGRRVTVVAGRIPRHRLPALVR